MVKRAVIKLEYLNTLIHFSLLLDVKTRTLFAGTKSKYQMHYRLRELVSPSNPPHFPPLLINEDTLNKSPRGFSNYLKLQFIKSYLDVCTIMDCFVCENSN